MKTHRRRWLKGTGAAVLAFPHVRMDAASPNGKLNVGIIGAGGRGGANTRGVGSEQVVAVCDTNGQTLEKAKAQFRKNGATAHRDWRDLLEIEKLDAVVISTADHHHAPASLAAMRKGLHVYCEKPLAHNVREARLMREVYARARKKSKIATQMGTQIHAGENFRRVV